MLSFLLWVKDSIDERLCSSECTRVDTQLILDVSFMAVVKQVRNAKEIIPI